MLKIVADDAIPFLPGCLEESAEVQYLPGADISAADCRDADALIIRTRTKCRKELLEGSKVSFLVSATIGTDHLDIPWLKEQGITWKNCPGCNSGSVNQYVLAAVAYMRLQDKLSFSGGKAGVIGYGNVGSKVAESLAKTGFDVAVCDPFISPENCDFPMLTLNEMFKRGGVLTVHVPLENSGEHKTHGFIDEDLLKQTADNSIIINTSRGEILEENALKKELRAGRLHAVIDVWNKEPHIDLELLDLCSLATPHIAGYSLDGKYTGTRMSVDSLSKFFAVKSSIPDFENTPQRWNKIVTPDCKLESEKQLSQIILQSYPIEEDDALLRQDPATFEKLRKNYRIRREFPCWQISEELAQRLTVLENLGFTIKK